MTGCVSFGFDRPTTWEYTLTLNMVWKSGNLLGSNRAGWQGRMYRAYREKAASGLRKHAKAIPTATGWRRVSFVRLYGKGRRPYDLENLLWGGKPIVDAMVELGYLLDDKPSLLDRRYEQQKAQNGLDSIEITIAE